MSSRDTANTSMGVSATSSFVMVISTHRVGASALMESSVERGTKSSTGVAALTGRLVAKPSIATVSQCVCVGGGGGMSTLKGNCFYFLHIVTSCTCSI